MEMGLVLTFSGNTAIETPVISLQRVRSRRVGVGTPLTPLTIPHSTDNPYHGTPL